MQITKKLTIDANGIPDNECEYGNGDGCGDGFPSNG